MTDFFPEFMGRRRKSGGLPQGDYRSLQVGQPLEMVTDDVIANLPRERVPDVKNPAQAQAVNAFLEDDWRTSSMLKKDGGVTPLDFVNAVNNNKYRPSLDITNEADVKADIDAGNLEVYKLGDRNIFFGIKNGVNYNDNYGIDLEAAGLSPNEKVVTGLINNEPGISSVAAPAAMMKAIEEGVTALDAFDVRTDKFPNGFLPSIYNEYGFEEAARLPFSKEEYLKNHTEADLKELEQAWRSDGWTPENGYPDLVVMKWTGDDNARATYKQQWLDDISRGDGSGTTAGATPESLADADSVVEAALGTAQRPGADQPAVGAGGVRDSNRAPAANRFSRAAAAVSQFDANQRRRYGIDDRTPEQIAYEQSITPEHAAATRARTEGIRKRGGVGGKAWVLPEQSGSPKEYARDAAGNLRGLPQVEGFNAQANARIADVAARYMERVGQSKYTPIATYVPPNPTKGKEIARLFDEMEHNPQDPEVKAAYNALIEETLEQYEEILKTGFKPEFIDFETMGDPYQENPRMVTEDIANNNHMYVFSTRDGFGSDADFDPADNPLLQETDYIISGQKALANDIFRIVHDYFGHAKEGLGFRAGGEENAWRSHAAMYSPLARRALTTETRGQNSWVNYGPKGESNRTASAADTVYADQKIGLLPTWVSESFGDPDANNKRILKSKFDYEIDSGNKPKKEKAGKTGKTGKTGKNYTVE